MARILVTGGAGFIGSHLVDRLVKQHRVTVIDNLFSGQRKNIHPQAKFIKLDIRSRHLVERIKQIRPDTIFHLAAQMNVRASIEDPEFDAQVNILGSLNVIKSALASRTGRFVFASSGGAVYGEVRPIPIPEQTRPQPEAPYGVAKYSIEHYLEFFHRVNGLSSINLRFANVYGPRQNPRGEAGVVAIFSERLREHEPIKIFGDGRQTRDYIHVNDVVHANLLAMRSRFVGSINVGTGIETSVNALVKMMIDTSGLRTKVVHYPAIAGELRRNAISPKQGSTKLGWKPNISLRAGLQQTLPSFGLPVRKQ